MSDCTEGTTYLTVTGRLAMVTRVTQTASTVVKVSLQRSSPTVTRHTEYTSCVYRVSKKKRGSQTMEIAIFWHTAAS